MREDLEKDISGDFESIAKTNNTENHSKQTSSFFNDLNIFLNFLLLLIQCLL